MLRLSSATLLIFGALTLSAYAQNEFCNNEMAPLMTERQTISAKLTAIVKNPKRPNAREQFCSNMTALIANMKKTVAYMTTNKDFCLIPDQVIAQVDKAIVQTTATRKKSCSGPPPQAKPATPGRPAVPRPPVELRLQ